MKGLKLILQQDHSRNTFIESLHSNVMVLKKTDAEKLQDFKIGIAVIDEVIENYAVSLENRGLPSCLLYTSPSPRDRG